MNGGPLILSIIAFVISIIALALALVATVAYISRWFA